MAGATGNGQVPEDHDAVRTRAVALLGELVSSKVRATLLAWAVPRLETRFSLTELSREVEMPISSLQHECYKLERLGVLQGRREGASRRYHVRLDHHLSRPLINLVVAALGIDTILRDALADTGAYELALIAGDAPGTGTGALVLVLVGESTLEGLDRAQRRFAHILAIDSDRLELAYFQGDDWREAGGSVDRLPEWLAGRPLQPIIGRWPVASAAS